MSLPVVLAVSFGAAVPPVRQQAALAAPAKAACPQSLPDEQAALVTARMCGGPIPIAGLTTETDQAVATAQGTVEWEHHYRPVRVRQGNGWVPVDTTLVPRADGSIGPVAAAADMAFSGGGSGPMVSMTSGKKSFKVASPLGTLRPPVLNGDTATYLDVIKGVDLQVRADVDGYTQVLVVKDRTAAQSPKLAQLAFAISGTGLSAKADNAGNLRVVDADGDLALSGNTPLMWDATAAAARGDARPGAERPAAPSGKDSHEVEMPVEVAPQQVTVTPNQQLLNASSTVYPVYIDPGFTANRVGFSVVSSASPDTAFWNSADDAFVGSWDGGTSKYRSMFSYDLTGSPLAGKYVSSATLNLNEVYAATCQPAQFEVWSVPVPTAQTTWSNQGAWYGQQSTSTASKGYSPAGVGGASDCPAGAVPMDVTTYMRSAASSGWNGVAFGVRATDENDPNAWKRFSNNPTLNVSYTAYPSIVETMTAPSTPCQTGASRPYINTLTPLLQARISDPEGALVRPEFSWSSLDGTPVGSAQPTPGQASGQTQATTVPTGAFTNGASYSWKARGFDGTTWGPWSTACEFTVDTTAPAAAPSVSSTTYSSGAWAGATGTAGSFTLGASGITDIAAYVYGLDTEPGTVVNTSSPGAGATISITPSSDGKHVLKVASRDRGGNLSPVTSYTFYVGTGAVLSPTTGMQTAGKVTLSGQSKSTATGITYQWRRGNTDNWTVIPTGDVKTTSGAAITWPAATTGSGAYPNLVWNVAQTVNTAEAGANPLDGPVQVRASLSGTSTGTSTGVTFTLNLTRTEAASTDIGPGSVNLLTGNYSVGASDAGAAGIQLGRTFNSRAAADTDPMFGPGWVSSVTVDAEAYSDLTVVGSLVQIGLPDGSSLGFTKATTTSTGATYAPEVGAEDVSLVYTSSGDAYTLTEQSGDKVTFSRRTTDPAGLYTATSMVAAGASTGGAISWEKATVSGVDVVRPTRALARPPAGVTCTTLVKGCRALNFTYATATTATTASPGDYLGRLKSVSVTAWDSALSTPAMRTVVMTQYSYDTIGRLRMAWNPQLDYVVNGVTGRVGTTYGYNTDGTLATLTPPGEEPWQFTYTTLPTDPGAGRLYKVTRSALAAGTAVETLVYNMPISGANAPVDMAANVARWGQTSVQVDATAVYPANIVPDGNPATGQLPSNTADDRVTVTYMDTNGRETNLMQPGGAINAIWYNEFGQVARELTAGNLTKALYASSTDTAAQEAVLARRYSMENLFSADGQRLLETLGPEHDVVLQHWGSVRGRSHTTYKYDENATGSGPFNLVTTETSTVQYVVAGATVDTDARTTSYQYDWELREPTVTIVDPAGLALTSRTTYDINGQVTSATAPAGNAAGTTPATQKTVYYQAGTGSGVAVCDNHPEWAPLPCRAFPAAQPSSGPELPTSTYTYDMLGQIRSVVESNSTTTLRTVTTDRDAAGRPTDTRTTSTIGAAVTGRRAVYDPATGHEIRTEAIDGAGTVTGSIKRSYDTLGRMTSYTDATGTVSTTSYDLLSRPAVVSDGKATQTLTYGSSTEKRNVVTQIVDGQAGTFTAAYDGDGHVITHQRPDGVTARMYYNETGRATGLEYVTTPGCNTADCTLYSDYLGLDAHGKIRWESSTFDDGGYGYDNAGRLTGSRHDSSTGCTLRTYQLDSSSNHTSTVTYRPNAEGECQDTTASATRTWTYDEASRATTSGYGYDALGRTVSLPGQDTRDGAGSGDVTLSYYSNDLIRTLTQGNTSTSYTLDVLTSRFGSYSSATAAGAAVSHVHHYSDDNDSPAWTAENGTYSRNIQGIYGLAAIYTGSPARLEWQYEDLRGNVVATATSAVPGFATTSTTDEYGNPISGGQRYGYLGGSLRSADNPGGLMAMGVRIYNPSTGRFTSPDPVPGGSANAYEYCYGDPVNCSDTAGTAGEAPSDKRNFNKAEAKRCQDHKIQCGIYLWAGKWALEESTKMFGKGKTHGKRNAYRHCIWSAFLRFMFGNDTDTKAWQDAHEDGWDKGNHDTIVDHWADMNNNFFGRIVGKTAGVKFSRWVGTDREAAQKWICKECKARLDAGKLDTHSPKE